MKSIEISEFMERTNEVLEELNNGEHFKLTQADKPIGMLLPYAKGRELVSRDAAKRIMEIRSKIGSTGIDVCELIREGREERMRRIAPWLYDDEENEEEE